MKTAYELAMERLNQSAPSVKLTEEQKARIAELERQYKAKIADREISAKTALDKAAEKGDAVEFEQVEQQLVHDRKKFQSELEEKKAAVREGR
jgi:hypothetical protein